MSNYKEAARQEPDRLISLCVVFERPLREENGFGSMNVFALLK